MTLTAQDKISNAARRAGWAISHRIEGAWVAPGTLTASRFVNPADATDYLVITFSMKGTVARVEGSLSLGPRDADKLAAALGWIAQSEIDAAAADLARDTAAIEAQIAHMVAAGLTSQTQADAALERLQGALRKNVRSIAIEASHAIALREAAARRAGVNGSSAPVLPRFTADTCDNGCVAASASAYLANAIQTRIEARRGHYGNPAGAEAQEIARQTQAFGAALEGEVFVHSASCEAREAAALDAISAEQDREIADADAAALASPLAIAYSGSIYALGAALDASAADLIADAVATLDYVDLVFVGEGCALALAELQGDRLDSVCLAHAAGALDWIADAADYGSALQPLRARLQPRAARARSIAGRTASQCDLAHN